MQRISIFACEAQPIVLEGLNKVLSNEPGFELVGSASDLASASARIVQIKPDVVLLDTAAGFKTTLQFVGELRFLCPTCRAVLWVNDLAEVAKPKRSRRMRASRSSMASSRRRIVHTSSVTNGLRCS